MAWSPLNVIVTVAACTAIVVPIIAFFVAGVIGTYFSRKEQFMKSFIPKPRNEQNNK